jgi:intracellular sulfur oxidation DsrE/DsrF family protein
MTSGRRTFLRRTLGGVAGLAVTDASVLGGATTISAADDPWLAAIAAKQHKAFMDVMHFFPDGTPFHRAKNLLNVMHESYGAADGDIGVAVGMHGRGLAHLMSQVAWNDLGLMEWLAPQLNGAEAAALKAGAGTFAAASAASVVELRARGVRFLACRETIAKWAQRVATQKGETPAAVSERIVRGLHEGVEPVPAMIAAAVLAEARGCGYVALA